MGYWIFAKVRYHVVYQRYDIMKLNQLFLESEKRLRELERRAASGDPDAMVAYERERAALVTLAHSYAVEDPGLSEDILDRLNSIYDE